MLKQIEDLLNSPESGTDAPTLALLEDTLTEGYAQALALEAERWRLERRLGEVARTAADMRPDPARVTEELSQLATRLSSADGELTNLRRQLASLQERARTLRRSANAA